MMIVPDFIIYAEMMDIVDSMDRSWLGSCQKCPERTRTTYVPVIPIETALGAVSVKSGDVFRVSFVP